MAIPPVVPVVVVPAPAPGHIPGPRVLIQHPFLPPGNQINALIHRAAQLNARLPVGAVAVIPPSITPNNLSA